MYEEGGFRAVKEGGREGGGGRGVKVSFTYL